MSCTSSTDLLLSEWTTSASEALDHLLRHGWKIPSPKFLYRPFMDNDWDYEYRSACASDLPEVVDLLRRQEAAERRSVIELAYGEELWLATIDFCPQQKLISVIWGADCPRHSSFERCVDPTWALRVLSASFSGLELPVEKLRIEYDSP